MKNFKNKEPLQQALIIIAMVAVIIAIIETIVVCNNAWLFIPCIIVMTILNTMAISTIATVVFFIVAVVLYS